MKCHKKKVEADCCANSVVGETWEPDSKPHRKQLIFRLLRGFFTFGDSPFTTSNPVNDIIEDRRLAGVVKSYIGSPPDIEMRVPDDIRKCAVFLGVNRKVNGVFMPTWAATGFLMGVPTKKIQGGGFMFLITAKHVLLETAGQQLLVRANTKDGKSKMFQVARDAEWYSHDDPTVDLSIIPVPFEQHTFDALPIPMAMILEDDYRKKTGIGIGDEVYISGLFRYHAGTDRNIPIIRAGTIAMSPEERVPVKNFGEMEAFLIESRSIGGLSGSPVFVFNHKEKQIHLLGIIHGHYDVMDNTIIDSSTAADAGIPAGVNTGIAIITPAWKLLDIFNSDILIKRMEVLENAAIAEDSGITTTDKTQ